MRVCRAASLLASLLLLATPCALAVKRSARVLISNLNKGKITVFNV